MRIFMAASLTVAISAGLISASGFETSALAAKCKLVAPPKGLKPVGHVRNDKGKKYRLSDRRGWIYIPSGSGWVVLKCFGYG